MKNLLFWTLAIIITLTAAVYQRRTGPTHPKRADVTVNGETYQLKMVRSLGLDQRPTVRLEIFDKEIEATLHYKRLNTDDPYTSVPFRYSEIPIDSWFMNNIMRTDTVKGYFARVEQQPPAGKLQYWFQITDNEGTKNYFRDEEVIIRFKAPVPPIYLIPHIIIMFAAMLLSTYTGLLAMAGSSRFRKLGILTFVCLFTGGMILGPIIQKYAFGDFWTGFPLGWDLTDNKTLIAVIFWGLAIIRNHKKERPLYSIIAAVVLLIIYSIPHSMYGSELDYNTGEIRQAMAYFNLL
jgi:hypothetical protein